MSMALLGVITGSVVWAPILVVAVSLFRPSLGARKVLVLNKVSGVIIAAFGVGAAIPGLMD